MEVSRRRSALWRPRTNGLVLRVVEKPLMHACCLASRGYLWRLLHRKGATTKAAPAKGIKLLNCAAFRMSISSRALTPCFLALCFCARATLVRMDLRSDQH